MYRMPLVDEVRVCAFLQTLQMQQMASTVRKEPLKPKLNLPMCHKEFGPGTLYGRLQVGPTNPCKAVFRGSYARMASRSQSRETRKPKLLSLPSIMTSPISGSSVRISRTTSCSLAPLISLTSCSIPNSCLLL